MYCNFVSYTSRARYLLSNNQSKIIIKDCVNYVNVFVFDYHKNIPLLIVPLEDNYSVISHCPSGDVNCWRIIDKPIVLYKKEFEKKTTIPISSHNSPILYTQIQYDDIKDLFIGLLQSGSINFYTDKVWKFSFEINYETTQIGFIQYDAISSLLLCSIPIGKIWIIDLSKVTSDFLTNLNTAPAFPFSDFSLFQANIDWFLLVEKN